MEKNEVYDYLARIYLDKQPQAKEKKGLPVMRFVQFFLIAAVIITAVAYIFFKYPTVIYKPESYGLHLSTGDELLRIQYDFTGLPSRKQGYEIELPGLNVKNFSTLKFRARRLKKGSALNLKVCIENKLKEKASCYINGIAAKWRSFEVPLSAFHEITRWDCISSISFIVEEWNTAEKEDCVYIDAIGLIRPYS